MSLRPEDRWVLIAVGLGLLALSLVALYALAQYPEAGR